MQTISINKYFLEDYREFMLENVELFFNAYNGALEDILEMFEMEMYVDNNPADQRKLSDEDMEILREIQLEVLEYVEDMWVDMNIPADILADIRESYENGEHEHYRHEAEYYAALLMHELLEDDEE